MYGIIGVSDGPTRVGLIVISTILLTRVYYMGNGIDWPFFGGHLTDVYLVYVLCLSGKEEKHSTIELYVNSRNEP